jgi:hypothetical protein
MSALACGQCGAGLPPPDAVGRSTCIYCGAEHRSDRSSEVLRAALAQSNRDSGVCAASEPLSSEDLARIPMTDEAVLNLLREHFAISAGSGRVFICPHILPKKEEAARRAHALHLPERERILVLYDATLLGSGEEGFLVTSRRLCWKNAGQPAYAIEWRDVDPDQLETDRDRLYVGTDTLDVLDADVLQACAFAFHVLALSGVPSRASVSGLAPRNGGGRVSSAFASPPPPSTTSFANYASHAEATGPDHACWHCRTPLYASTPQCAYCGALPKKRKGWLRAG